MRKLFVLGMAVVGLVGLGGFVRDARAGVTVDLLFVGQNGAPIAPTNTVTANVGDTLTMALRLSNDQQLTIAVFSTNYDLDLDNELDVVSQFQWGGVALNKQATDFFAPIGGFSPTTATFVGSFQGATSNFSGPRLLPITPGGYQMGTITWHVAAGVNNDGADIISGLLSLTDGIFDAQFNAVTGLLFRSATVNTPIPEPGTAMLLGLGFVGLVLVGRRNRS